jgi:WD40 repeat protein
LLAPQPKQQPAHVLTFSTDGFVKLFDAYNKPLKSHFVSQAGICAGTQLTPDSFAFAGLNNEVFLFSLFSGTVVQSFYAHDEQITAVLCKGSWLITCSLDQIIKFWDLAKGVSAGPAFTLYEHEEGILSAALHPN